MSLELVELHTSDLSTVKEIYDHYILHSTATFHTTPISIEELKEILPIGHHKYRSYLIRYDGEVAGYCYYTYHKKRPAYDRTAEVTIYLVPGYKGKGIGKIVLKELEADARKHGILVFMGVVTGNNDESVALFRKSGYDKCGHFRQVGEKFGQVLDVVAYQKML